MQQFVVRLTDVLKHQLRLLAAAHDLSMNQMIVRLIEQAVKEKDGAK